MGEANTHYKVRQYVQRKFIDVGSTAPGFTPTGDTFALTIFICVLVKCIL